MDKDRISQIITTLKAKCEKGNASQKLSKILKIASLDIELFNAVFDAFYKEEPQVFNSYFDIIDKKRLNKYVEANGKTMSWSWHSQQAKIGNQSDIDDIVNQACSYCDDVHVLGSIAESPKVLGENLTKLVVALCKTADDQNNASFIFLTILAKNDKIQGKNLDLIIDKMYERKTETNYLFNPDITSLIKKDKITGNKLEKLVFLFTKMPHTIDEILELANLEKISGKNFDMIIEYVYQNIQDCKDKASDLILTLAKLEKTTYSNFTKLVEASFKIGYPMLLINCDKVDTELIDKMVDNLCSLEMDHYKICDMIQLTYSDNFNHNQLEKIVDKICQVATYDYTLILWAMNSPNIVGENYNKLFDCLSQSQDAKAIYALLSNPTTHCKQFDFLLKRYCELNNKNKNEELLNLLREQAIINDPIKQQYVKKYLSDNDLFDQLNDYIDNL